MGITEFLHEVDRLARMQSAHLRHDASPRPRASLGGDPPCCGLGPFTTDLLRAARGDAFEAADTPAVQVLEAERNCSSTRWQFITQPLGGAATRNVDDAPDSRSGAVREPRPDRSSTGRQAWTERAQAA